jgi:hypothetical protein
MTRPLYIFDLDGTLALIDHRRPILDDKTDPDRWRKFYAACVADKPNQPVIRTLIMLRDGVREVEYDEVRNDGRVGVAVTYVSAEIWIWSGRGSEVELETHRWLDEYVGDFARIRMRPAGDYTSDVELKQRWLDEMAPEDRERLVAVFDDRNSVVEMWRANGIACFQVAPGDF